MSGYNRTRYVEQLLERTETLPPSFTVHLHTEYWVLNNGSKFLYHNQIASLLDDIRAHRIPVDFLELFDSARVPFYDGCMIVELLDYRPQKSSEPALKNPERTRVVLHPSPETLWADICSLNQRYGGKWTDKDALEIEAKLLRATTQPLCLDPDPNLTRIVNNVLRASTPSMPLSLKRKASAMEPEEDGYEKAKRERLLGFMAPREKRLHASNYRLLDAIEINRQKKETEKVVGVTQHGNQYMAANSQSVQPVPQPTPTPQVPVTSQSPTDHGDKGVQKETTQTYNAAFHANGTHTPVPVQPSHQFGAQPSTTAQLPAQAMQPQVYANLQAAKDAANNRTPTPAQQLQLQQQQIQNYQQHYFQHQLQQQQMQPVLPRPPSQPQHPQAPVQASVPLTQPQTSPQPPAQQLSAQPQRFTHTPKPPQTQPTPMQSSQTQAQYTGTTPSFQSTVSNPHFLQPAPSGVRPIQKAQQGPMTSGQPQLTIPANPQAQIYYNQQLQQQPGQQSGAQQPPHQQQQPIIQRMSQVAAASGGRTTPSHVQQSPRVQAQPLQPNRAVTATPSPVKGSPIVNQQSLAAVNQPRVSPMQAKAQIPIQQAGHSHPVPVGQQPQGQQSSNAGGIQIAPPRLQFQPQYNPSPLRPVIHGNTQITPSPASGVNAASGPPAIVHASPIVGGGRPLSPVVGADVKSQQQTQANQGQQQQPIRRPTPLQQQAAMAQMQSHVQSQTPQLQQQQLPQAQGPTQSQQLPLQTQTAVTTSQMQQTPVQPSAQLPSAQQQAQQMAAYTQLYGYAPFWRVPHQQQQQGQGQQNPTSHMQLAHQQAAQQQQLLSAMIQQISQQALGSGQRFSAAQIQALAQQKLHQHQVLAQAQAQAQVQGQAQVGAQHQGQGVQQAQQLQAAQQPPPPLQRSPAQAQAMMMGKMQMQMTPPQMHNIAQGVASQQQQQGQTTLTHAQMQLHYQQQAAAQAQAVQQGAQKGKIAGKGVLAKKGPMTR